MLTIHEILISERPMTVSVRVRRVIKECKGNSPVSQDLSTLLSTTGKILKFAVT